MANGKRRKPHGGRNGDRRGPRRTPPPETTGEEAKYLRGQKQAASPMVFRLVDGRTVRGRIEGFDRDMIRLTCDDDSNLVVRKSEIRYAYEDSRN
jgi:hypothetical protein